MTTHRTQSTSTVAGLAVVTLALLAGGPAAAAQATLPGVELPSLVPSIDHVALDEVASPVDPAEPAATQDDEDDPDTDDGKKTRRGKSPRSRKRIIKVVQRKHFMKMHRLEATVPGIGLVTNDPFLRRILFSGKFEFHITEISSVGAWICFSPNLGDSDRKPLTNQLEQRNEVVPDISRIIFAGIVDYGVSPIFGKIELGQARIINYDIYLAAGAGVLYTKDDEELVQGGEEQYRDQFHPVTSFAFGFRIAFNEWFGIRLEGRHMTHIEQVSRAEGLNLEMKNNFAVQFGTSFFLPPKMKGMQKQ